MEYSRHNVYSTMHICWGAQAGLPIAAAHAESAASRSAAGSERTILGIGNAICYFLLTRSVRPEHTAGDMYSRTTIAIIIICASMQTGG